MHPLKRYLTDVACWTSQNGVGASRQSLYRIFSGVRAPKPMLARRIVGATGGAVTLDMLYGDKARASAEIIGFRPREEELLLDGERLNLAIAVVINHLRAEDCAPVGNDLLAVAADAVVNTYAALARLTTRQGPARLAQALRPVLEEILKETGSAPAPSALERRAELAAELYFQAPSLERP